MNNGIWKAFNKKIFENWKFDSCMFHPFLTKDFLPLIMCPFVSIKSYNVNSLTKKHTALGLNLEGSEIWIRVTYFLSKSLSNTQIT